MRIRIRKTRGVNRAVTQVMYRVAKKLPLWEAEQSGEEWVKSELEFLHCWMISGFTAQTLSDDSSY